MEATLSPPDVELLAAWRTGDRRAGGELFARHFRNVFRFLRGKVGPAAEDLTQRTFLGLLESPCEAPIASFRAYLFGIARNHLYMYLRERERDAARFDAESWSLLDIGLAPLDRVAAEQEQRVLEAALDRVPLNYRIAIELFYWQGLSIAEVAEAQGVPAGTVKARLSRAREMLRAALANDVGAASLRDRISGELERWLRACGTAHRRSSDGAE